MNKTVIETEKLRQEYNKRSAQYDRVVNCFNLFRWLGFDMVAWRRKAIDALNLKRGDTVVDIGCGTGLNFPLLQQVIGPSGKIIGVDLSEGMLNRARRRVVGSNWQNVELVCADASRFEFPDKLDGVLSTFALILVPECGRVISNGCQALALGRSFSVLGMAWPAGYSLKWRRLLFFMEAYGVTAEVLERRPWETIWQTMEACLDDFSRRRFWMGMMYLAAGRKANE